MISTSPLVPSFLVMVFALCNFPGIYTENSPSYLFTLPRELQVNTLTRGCITFKNLPPNNPLFLTISLIDAKKEAFLHKTVHDLSNGQHCFSLPIKDLPDSISHVKIFGNSYSESGYNFTAFHRVHLKPEVSVTFIETDKPQYKPGDDIKLRVLTINALLKPNLAKLEEVWIENPKGVRMEQWNEVSNSKGLTNLTMRLSEEPVLGLWTIKVKTGAEIQRQNFRVEKYVLEKIDVTVTTPDYLVPTDDAFNFTICAKYSYGKPVAGIAGIEARFYRQNPRQEPHRQEKELNEMGCQAFSIQTEKLASRTYLEVDVKEEGAGTTINKTTDPIRTTKIPVTLSFSQHTPSYKPTIPKQTLDIIARTTNGHPSAGETLHVTFQASDDKYLSSSKKGGRKTHWLNAKEICKKLGTSLLKIDSKEENDYIASRIQERHWIGMNDMETEGQFRWAAADIVDSGAHNFSNWGDAEPNDLLGEDCVELLPNGDWNDLSCKKEAHFICEKAGEHAGLPLKIERNVTSDANGLARIAIPEEMISATQIHVEAEALTFRNGKEALRDGPMTSPPINQLLTSWFSPSGSYIKIMPSDDVVKCQEDRIFDLFISNMPQDQFLIYYDVVSLGNISMHGHKAVPGKDVSKKIEIDIKLNKDVKSKFQLLVYYVRTDGEVVSDVQNFFAEKCMDNEVSLKFNKETKAPGKKVKLKLKAKPDSVCGISVIDRSVASLGQSSLVSKGRIFEWLDEVTEIQGISFENEDLAFCRRNREGMELSKNPSGQHDAIKAFRDAGMLVVTDLLLETRPCLATKVWLQEYHELDQEEVNPQVRWEYDDEDYPELLWDYDSDYDEGRSLASSAGSEEMDVHIRVGTSKDVAGDPDVGAWDISLYNIPNLKLEKKKKQRKVQEKIIRSHFPETFLWQLETVDSDGNSEIKTKVPHTITTWDVKAICSSEKHGVGVSDTTSLRVFQPFFVSIIMPYSVIKGEQLTLKVTVFNYLSNCIPIRLKLEKDMKKHFTVTTNDQFDFCICGNRGETKEFQITAKRVGDLEVQVKAVERSKSKNACLPTAEIATEAAGISDTVIKKLLVEPEGIETESNFCQYICLEPDGNPEFNHTIILPIDEKRYVGGSGRLIMTAIGDVLGPALVGFDKLLRLPTGCGEQNMVKFAPNVFILQYLAATNQVNNIIKEKAISFLKIGYQRQLGYRHNDGSYSAFGSYDPSGSLWLTAFVVKCFSQAKQFVRIDQQDLDKSISWLKTKQKSSGAFQKVGKLFSKALKGGLNDVSSEVGLTAYTTIALLEADVPTEDKAITSAMNFIGSKDVRSLKTYTLAIVANTFSLFDQTDQRFVAVMNELSRRKRVLDGTYWKDENDHDVTVRATDVEMTSYVLLTYCVTGSVNEAMSVVGWLSKQRNSYGGFKSTQDTVIAIQALAKISSIIHGRSGQMDVQWTRGKNISTAEISPSNRLKLHEDRWSVTELESSRKVNVFVHANASGCALVQATLRYNIFPEEDNDTVGVKNQFGLAHKVKVHGEADTCKMLHMTTCVTHNGASKSGMVVTEVKMVSGWIPLKISLKQVLKDVKLIKRFEVDAKMIMFYLDDMEPANEVCWNFLVERNAKVDFQKPGSVKVYDYYDPDCSKLTRKYVVPC